ncbi:fused MFS/spermidine synthase [Catenovulum sp. 2E275]|uniref:fused MFS/spermidine synthase n=1 Tax=Catenovulum sp. 2E275 TaxID=2980497 RepID=UPI0021CEE7DB|nr:fused MFS/spermidine synthase [Catenovulum sp. 2E275]MCU4676329.1 fused MFS/spermidine synthase [Catenovulum sp. 2E275]
MKKFIIILLAFCAGFSIMSFELLGGRMLAPFFGSSVYVWGSIITVFMLALSMGYLFGGRLSLNNPSLTKFGCIFIIAAFTLLPAIYFAESLFEFVFQHIEDPRYGSLVAASLVFLIPSIILGMIAPYSVRLLTQSASSSGQTAGFLYFVSTLGSAIGTIMTSFYLVLWLEVNQILWLIFTTLLCSGLIALSSAKKPELSQPVNNSHIANAGSEGA